MLKITDRAAETLEVMVASEDVPKTAGLRISSAEVDGEPTFAMRLVASPEPNDRVADATTVPLYLEPRVVELLSDQRLDAVTEGERTTLVLTPGALAA